MSESARNPVKYSIAELLSFKIVPKTCPAVEKAFDIDDKNMESVLDEVLPKYNVTDSKELRLAFYEALAKITNGMRYDGQNVVKYQGTYPLRLALIQMIARDLGVAPDQASVYEYWIKSSGHHKIILPNMAELDKAKS